MEQPIDPLLGYGLLLGAMTLVVIAAYFRVRYLDRQIAREDREERERHARTI